MTNDGKKPEDARMPPAIEATVVAAVGAAWGARWKILAGIGGLLVTAAGLGYFAAGRVAEAAVREAAFIQYVKALSMDDDFRKAVAGVSGSPVGSVVAWPSDVAPPYGWAVCDGTEIDAKSEDRISVVLGATYGAAPNGKVKLPDFRGCFLRGSGGMAAPLGQEQPDEVGPHDHRGVIRVGTHRQGAVRAVHTEVGETRWDGTGDTTKATTDQWPGMETRPKNYAVHWIIRVR